MVKDISHMITYISITPVYTGGYDLRGLVRPTKRYVNLFEARLSSQEQDNSQPLFHLRGYKNHNDELVHIVAWDIN